MYRFLIHVFITLGSLCVMAKGFAAVNLMGIYEKSLERDPVFQAAYSDYLSVMQNVPIARADLLPALLGIGSVDQVTQSVRSETRADSNDPGSDIVSSSRRGSFLQQFYDVTLTQPLFNYAAWKQLQTAKATVRQAQAVFSAAAQDLILRVAQSYFTVLDSEDILRFTRAEKRASARRLQETTERYNVGLEAITTVYEAQAEYDRIVASEIAAENDVMNSREALRRLTGQVYTDLERIEGDAPLISPKPNKVSSWVETATNQNYNILANQFATEAAKENIAAQGAANLPTLDAIGSYTFIDGGNVVAAGGAIVAVGNIARFRSQEAAFGVLAQWTPIQGGRILANKRQARYDYETTLANLEDTYRTTIVNTHQSYNDIISGISRIKADRQAISSGQNSLDSVEAQFRVGTRTIVDVLVSQRNLFDVQRAHATDTYQYILATLQLKYAAGTLSDTDLAQINRWLYNPPLELKEEYKVESYESILEAMEFADFDPLGESSQISQTPISEPELAEAEEREALALEGEDTDVPKMEEDLEGIERLLEEAQRPTVYESNQI